MATLTTQLIPLSLSLLNKNIGGFLKMVGVSPTTLALGPTRNDQHLGCVFWGYQHFKQIPLLISIILASDMTRPIPPGS